VKAKALLLFVSFACAPAACLFGQVDCTTSTKLVCEFPVSAGALGAFAVGGPFTQAALKQANPINASIAAQLTQLPIPSATVGVVSLREKGSDVGVPFDNLGPILTDRPDTVGKGHVFLGFSYQHFNFNAVDGVGLPALPVAFTYTQASAFNPADTQTYYGSVTNDVSFRLDQYVGVLTYGVTKTTDLSVIVPSSSVKLGVSSYNFQAFYYDSVAGTYTNKSPAASTIVATTGSASGVGDVTIGMKQMLLGGEGSRAAMAAGVNIRIPTGDSLNYLGSGAVGVNFYGLIEYRARLAPHVKVGYQWNGNSQLVNLQLPPSTRLPGGLQYAAGADARIVHSLTLAVDLLGNQFDNTPSFALSTSPVCPQTSGACAAPLASSGLPSVFTTSTNFNNTYSTANVSAGLKWSPFPHFLVYGNVMKQINNVGLRSDLVPLFGIAYNFKAGHSH
jgi:hypothetical protein